METEVQERLRDINEALSKDGIHSKLINFRMPFLSSMLTHPELTHSDFFILSFILIINMSEITCKVPDKFFIKYIGISPDQVTTSIRKLIKLNFINYVNEDGELTKNSSRINSKKYPKSLINKNKDRELVVTDFCLISCERSFMDIEDEEEYQNEHQEHLDFIKTTTQNMIRHLSVEHDITSDTIVLFGNENYRIENEEQFKIIMEQIALGNKIMKNELLINTADEITINDCIEYLKSK